MKSDAPVRRIVILGGGTAGWLTAGILAADHCADQPDGIDVTLIESAKVPILGVGEGTWPTMRDTLRRIGISETDFLRRCNASFKQGSRFDGWRTGAGDDSYYHPFEAPPSADEVDALRLWDMIGTDVPFAEVVSHQAALCQAGRAPKQVGTPEFAAVANYGYHLDAPAFAKLLAEHCTARLGVRHVIGDVTGLVRDEQGFVSALTTDESGSIEGDLFIDCSGMAARLIGQEMGVGVHDASDVLFNDRALAIHVPHERQDAAVQSQTNGTAMPFGWVWDIALQNRRGVGHVFSSRFADEGKVRSSLQDYLDRTAPWADVRADDARLLQFRSAYRETPWVKNVVGVGMSMGFVEPLEASAIVMIELAAGMVSDTLPPVRASIEGASERFNRRFSYRWARIIDFLKLHYILSERREPYWLAHRDPESWTPRLRELMARWRFEPPSREDFPDSREIFPADSYAYVLHGMRHRIAPRPTVRRTGADPRIHAALRQVALTTERYLAGLPSNRELLDHIQHSSFSKA